MLRVSEAVLPSSDVAVTVIAQRPAVSSRGGKANEPSSATSIVAGLGAPGPPVPGLAPGPPDGAGEAGAAVAAGPPLGAGPPAWLAWNAALTVTLLAFVVVPSIAIAPLPYVVPSTGCETSSVGAWMTRNGTWITTVRG